MLRRHRVLIITVAVVIAALAGGLAWHWAETRPALPQGPSPESVTRVYFELVAAGQYRAAKRYMLHPGPEYAPDAGWYRGDRIISMSKATPVPNDHFGSEYGSHSQLCHVLVRYHSKWWDPDNSDPPGDWEADAFLGRKTPTSPWRLLYVGCPI